MPSIEHLQRRRNELQVQHDLLSERILRLRKANAIEADAAVGFKLEKQIEQAEAEREKVAEQLATLDEGLSRIEPDYVRYCQNLITRLDELERLYTPLYGKFVPMTRLGWEGQKFDIVVEVERRPVLDLVRENSRLILTGSSGAGKTTALEYIVLDAARKVLAHQARVEEDAVVSHY